MIMFKRTVVQWFVVTFCMTDFTEIYEIVRNNDGK